MIAKNNHSGPVGDPNIETNITMWPHYTHRHTTTHTDNGDGQYARSGDARQDSIGYGNHARSGDGHQDINCDGHQDMSCYGHLLWRGYGQHTKNGEGQEG